MNWWFCVWSTMRLVNYRHIAPTCKNKHKKMQCIEYLHYIQLVRKFFTQKRFSYVINLNTSMYKLHFFLRIPCINMSKRLTKVVHLLNLVFTVMCLCHVSFTLYNAINPPRPEIKVYDKALEDVPFPILFKFCGKDIHNRSGRFKKYGYEDEVRELLWGN